jgi:hypothetical protein
LDNVLGHLYGPGGFHTNTQLFGVLDEHNRFKIGEEVTEP